jgi:hypothetical protein
VGLDLSRKRIDVCLISGEGELVEHFRAPADRDSLYGLTRRVAVYDEPVRGVVESMNGARFVPVHKGLADRQGGRPVRRLCGRQGAGGRAR